MEPPGLLDQPLLAVAQGLDVVGELGGLLAEQFFILLLPGLIQLALRIPGWPVKMSDSCVPVQAAPLLGADNAHIYSQLLGFTPEELTALKTQEVI